MDKTLPNDHTSKIVFFLSFALCYTVTSNHLSNAYFIIKDEIQQDCVARSY